jgi:hypothetical protein
MQQSFSFRKEYPYLAIDFDGIARESKRPCFNNGLGCWFYENFFKYDNQMRRVEDYSIADYDVVYDARGKGYEAKNDKYAKAEK